MSDVTRSLVAATTSSRFTTPIFWADPGSGISYNLQVQIPEAKTTSIEDLGNVPVTTSGGRTVLLRNIAMCFDNYLEKAQAAVLPRFSNAI